MVVVQRNGEGIEVVMRPNCSLSWRGNQYILLFMLIWLGGFGLAFAAMGAWMILPFVGLELLLLGASLYYVSWKLSHCQILRIDGDQVYVAKGTTYPKASWTLRRDEVVVHVAAASHPYGTPTIQLLPNCGSPEAVRLGEFLNQQDCKELLQELVAARLATRHSAGRISQAF